MSKANIETSPKEELLDGKSIHALAKMFPPMTDDEFAAISEDMKTNGLVDPVVLYEDKILDGVHRLKACLQSEIKPRFKEWDGECGSPFQFVCTKNLSRRNLTSGQKAVIAVTLEKEFAKAAKLRMSARSRAKPGVEKFPPHEGKGKARDAAAQAVGVNSHYVTDAKALAAGRPDLLKEVWLGQLTLASAMQRLKGDQRNDGDPTHKVSIVFKGRKFTCEDQPEAVALELAAGFVDKDIAVRLTDKRLEKAASMYPGTKTWSPFMGCNFDCTYCKATFQRQAKRRKLQEDREEGCEHCYRYTPHEHPDRLNGIPGGKKSESDVTTVFVCASADISFCGREFVGKIIEAIKRKNERDLAHDTPLLTYYLQSKRPQCFTPFLKDLPKNVILLTTLETNRDEGYKAISKAPPLSKRFRQFLELDYPRKAVTVEPMLDFDVDEFAKRIVRLAPEHVYMGYNSHEAEVVLPEPPHRKVVALAEALLARGIEVRGKDLRGLPMPKGIVMPKAVWREQFADAAEAVPDEDSAARAQTKPRARTKKP